MRLRRSIFLQARSASERIHFRCCWHPRHPACRGGSSAFALRKARVVQKRWNHWDKPEWRLFNYDSVNSKHGSNPMRLYC